MSDNIWVETPTVDGLNLLHEGCSVAHLGILITEVGANFLRGKMPVDARTKQPFGLLHGGAAALLLETLGSAAANHCVDQQAHMCVGLEINCNHVRAAREGWVFGQASALHIGRTSMIWGLEVRDEQERLVTVGRLTSSVVRRR